MSIYAIMPIAARRPRHLFPLALAHAPQSAHPLPPRQSTLDRPLMTAINAEFRYEFPRSQTA